MSVVFQTDGISLDFKLVTSTLSGVFIQRAFLHVDDTRAKLRALSLVQHVSCVHACSRYRCFCMRKKPTFKSTLVPTIRLHNEFRFGFLYMHIVHQISAYFAISFHRFNVAVLFKAFNRS